MEAKRTDMVMRSLSGERFTPFSLANKLGAVAILESASFTHGKDRYSILLLQEAFRIIQEIGKVSLAIDQVVYPTDDQDILSALSRIAHQNPLPPDGIPLPGAGIGYLGYEFCRRCDTIRMGDQEDDLHIPEAMFVVGHIYLVFDHFTDTIHLFGMNYEEHTIDLDDAVGTILKRLEDLDFSYLSPPQAPSHARVVTNVEASRNAFLEGVAEIKRNIVEGNLLQAVLSRRLEIESSEPALGVYRRLRSKNPSPYLFLIDFGTFQLVGASPESIVRVRDGVASIRPIAGTRRRGNDKDEDELLRKELLDDPKERAEHLMLVDLARNDLGRVCMPGSVRVARSMDVEHFSHVMHIVSDVVGQIDPHTTDPIDVLRASFPAGTVSGAPKIEAIQRVSKIERQVRSFYGGAVGYLEPDGDLDFCISIRCAMKKGTRWILQAGAGIVHASEASREWIETEEKLGALRSVLEEGVL
jgi:anthranilate synthase component 1